MNSFMRNCLLLIGLMLTLLASAPLQHVAAQPSDIPMVLQWSSTESDHTQSSAWGDVDGDGDLDLAVGDDGQPNRLYRNDAGVLTAGAVWSSVEADNTQSVAWGDVDGDGDLDLAVGNDGQPNRVYRNDDGTLSASAAWSSAEADHTQSLAWGDGDGDGDLDLAVGNWDQPNRLYRNDDGTLTTGTAWSSTEADYTSSVAWGDVDGDGDLDLAVGNHGVVPGGAQPNRLYRNDSGALTVRAVWSSVETDRTSSVAWGDVDGDGDLDLAVGNVLPGLGSGQPNRLYRNDAGALTTAAVWSSTEVDETTSVAWGDYDGDSDLDLAAGNDDQSNRVYRNEGGMLVAGAVWSSVETDVTHSISWGDVDGDGDLDLAVGNDGQPNRVYRNTGALLTPDAVWSSDETGSTSSVAWGDVDGDGDLDLAAGDSDGPNRLYRNDTGTMTTTAVWSSDESDLTSSVAWGDYDGDGDLDLAAGNSGQPNRLYRNDNGTLTTSAVWSSDEVDGTQSVTWGDYDGDGDLDLAAGNDLHFDFDCNCHIRDPNRVYRNDGGVLTTSAVWSSDETDSTWELAWGDVEGDGDLDLAVSNLNEPNQLYRNAGGVLTTSAVWSSSEADATTSVAWGDVDGDGDLDLAVGNNGQPNRLYRNNDGSLTTAAVWSSAEADETQSIAWGDYDGDGDLDLVVGNLGRPISAGYRSGQSRLYRNDNGSLNNSASWSSHEVDHVWSVAWGDVDGDGDLDLAVGNWGSNRLYRNLRRGEAPMMDCPPYVTIPRPGATDDADFFSTPQVIQATNIPVTYTLFDPEGDGVRRIFPEFSPDGGGQWWPATPGPGGDGMTNLAASPEGTSHTFVWNAEANLIRSDNVVFRIRAQPSYTHSPILWPAVDGKSPLFRVAAPWYVKVVDDNGNPVAGATVFTDGKEIGTADPAGLLNPGPLEAGTALVALARQAEQPTARAGHDGWAYRTHLTSLSWDDQGAAKPFIVGGAGEQRLVVRRDNPLVLFNLVVSVEWDATDDYLDQIARAVRHASTYLYDLTDGQMAFGQVSIYDNGVHWADADIQISTKNIVRPHAYIGGIISEDTSHVVRVGRHWDGNSGNQGAWDEADGYRTLVHEFGHYALHLYDEYFAYVFDEHGNLMGEVPASCSGPENRNPATDATNASAMDYQYTTSELAMRGVPGLWSSLCESTAQWQLNGESDWETLTREYADAVSPPRWRFTTPADRGRVLAGPEGLPASLPHWPQVEIYQDGPSAPPRQLTAYGPQGRYWGAIVALYKLDGRVIGQGFTDSNGRLDVYGAVEGDILRAAAFDGGLAGSVTVETEMHINLTLGPVERLASITTQGVRAPPHLRVVAEPSQDPGQVDLLVFLKNFGPGADPSLVVTEPGGEVGQAPTLSYSPASDSYEGQFSFSATMRGMGRIQAAGAVGNSLVRLQSTYRLQRAVNDRGQDVYSNDGDLNLHLEPGSLPGDEAYLVVMPPGAIPGPLPDGLVLVGDPYDVTASGALVTLEQPAVLKLHYDAALVDGATATQLGVYRWDPSSERWWLVPGTLDEEQRAMVASVRALGTYALLAPAGPWIEPSQVFLPLVLK
ncbi:MAG: FG-GAP repeat domain-containing protein [Anaerolineae bacterium]